MTREQKVILANILHKECGVDVFDEEGNVLDEHPLWDIIWSQRLAEREACSKELRFQLSFEMLVSLMKIKQGVVLYSEAKPRILLFLEEGEKPSSLDEAKEFLERDWAKE